MSAGAAQPIAFAAVAHILECAGVDQLSFSFANQANTQSSGMSVTSAARPKRASIDQQLLSGGFVRHQVDAAVGKSGRNCRGFRGRQQIKLRKSLHAQEPQSFFARSAGGKLEIATLVENRTGCQRVKQMLSPIALGIKQPSTVVVADFRL